MFGSSSTTRTRAPSLFTSPCWSSFLGVCSETVGKRVRISRALRPSGDPVDVAREIDEPGRQPSRLEPGDRAAAHDDGGGRRNVGVDTGARHDAGGAPAAVRPPAGRRVGYVVEDDAASSPAPYGGAGGGDPSRLDPDGLLRVVDRGRAV